MTKRKDELTRRSYDQLMHAAGDRMDEDALRALRSFQKIREQGSQPEIWYSPYHGWVVKDPLAE